MNDEQLIDHIAAAFDSIEPVPADLTDIAFAAIGMRTLDAQLAELVFDSWAQDQQLAMRSTATASHVMSFSVTEGVVDVEVHTDGAVIGQIEIDNTDSTAASIQSLTVELGSGATETVEVDEFGRFRLIVTASTFRLRLGTIVTPWITR